MISYEQETPDTSPQGESLILQKAYLHCSRYSKYHNCLQLTNSLVNVEIRRFATHSAKSFAANRARGHFKC